MHYLPIRKSGRGESFFIRPVRGALLSKNSLKKETIMKNIRTTLLLYLLGISLAVSAQQEGPGAEAQKTDPAGNKAFWGTFFAGYSNNGVMGNAGIYFRSGRVVFGAGYYKSHICYKDDIARPYFLNDGFTDNHHTVSSWSATVGWILPGNLHPEISAGISWTNFLYLSTECIEHNVTLPRIWQTIAGSDYTSETRDQKIFRTAGIPLALTLHGGGKHTAGMEMRFAVDINPHSLFYSAGLGIRVGRLKHKN
jgi:hypothetical protein